MESTYKPLTEELFREFMYDLYNSRSLPEERDWVLWTGQEGMNQIDHQMHVIGSMNHLSILEESHKITKQESRRLSEMINSPDRENITIADLIMDQK